MKKTVNIVGILLFSLITACSEAPKPKKIAPKKVEMSEEDMPEKLVIAALLVKLVEKGKLGPEDADGLIEKYLG